MPNRWKPHPQKYVGNTPFYRRKTKRELKPLRNKLFLQTISVVIIFLFIWGIFQFNSPLFLGMQGVIRTWFTKDTDITPVIKTINKIGLYGDSFERASYEVISTNVKPQSADPMTIPVSGTVTKPFGWTMVKGQSAFNDGLYIEADAGSPVKAAYDGTVIEMRNDAKLGRTIVLSHENGLVTIYGYCSEILVNEDQQVKQGQVIAKVGRINNSSKGQLYFQVNKLGEPVNPVDLLQKGKDV